MKVLVVGPSWVGDMVMAQPLFMTIKQHYPSADIDVLAPDWSRPLLERMPEVRNEIVMPVGHGSLNLKGRKQLGLSLRAENYNQAIVLPNSFKSALVPAWAKIPLRTGWRGEMRYGLLNDLRVLDKQRYPLMVERFVALGLPKNSPLPENLPAPKLVVNQANVTASLERYQLNTDKPVLALCPGAEFGPAKRWPEQHYAAVASEWLAKGWQVWLFGSAKDQPVAELIKQAVPAQHQDQVISLAGNTSLADAVDLLSLASAVVSNDSGLMHIAAALEHPLVVVYGSTSPDFTPPLSKQKEIVRLGLSCSPCFKRECPLEHLNCLKELMPDQVNQALNLVIEKSQTVPVEVVTP
ncbi:lipopolysaccharide heptosyltransferase II [Spartinivicinus ruber]|uniref:lipopolysaccharide heptosyltransferase II n=1 Tax=Spartinivicinus ruber TaxID=2683272 RepID=UPI0013D604D3|nr:lipopolysaccharide heptosyltransferase II [Spartinivicinus ruber]